MRNLILPLLVSLLSIPAIACSSASTDAEGGEPRFDAAPPSGPVADGGGVGTTRTWTDLYADYFGNAQRAACAGNGTCHGTAAQTGAQSSGGFVCPLGDKDACYKSLTSKDVGLVTAGDTTSDPKQSGLYGILRKTTGGGTMPKSPPYQFTPADLDRLTAWLKAGAPND